MQWHSRIYGGGGLFDYSVKSGPDFVKVRFGQVGDEVGQGQVWPFDDLVGQDQGQELDNFKKIMNTEDYSLFVCMQFSL